MTHRVRSSSVTSITSATSVPVARLGDGSFDNRRADRVWLQQHVADRMKLKQKMSKPMRMAYEMIIEPLFPPGEPFDEYMRKVSVLTYGVMCSGSTVPAVWLATTASTDEYGWNSKRIGCVTISVFVTLHMFLFNCIYIFKTKTCPIWLTNLSVVGVEIVLLLLTFLVPQTDCRTLSLCSMLLVSLMSIKLFPLHAIIHMAAYILDYLREEFKEEIPQLVFSWDADKYPLSEKILFAAYSILPEIVAVLGLWVIISGYIKRSKEAQVTNVMTITIADQLQRYDTAAVGATITRNKEQVGEKLLDAFDAIRTNLESYRPHIPRYLIDAALERAEAAEAAELQAIAESERATEQGLDTDDEGSLASTYGDGSLTTTPSMTMSSCGTPRNVRADTEQSTFHGIVSSVLLRIIDDENPTTPLQINIMNRAVEEINVIAAATSASVHHIQQGVMLVTWNATKRTGNHEIRACTFATRAVAALQAFEGLKDCAAAAVFSCKATAYFAGSSQMHFMLSHGESSRHMDMLAIAQKHQTVVCSPSIVRNADVQFAFVGFGIDCKEKLVYELVEARGTIENEDEWLYTLNTQEADAMSPYSRVTTAAAKILLPGGLDEPTISTLPGVYLEGEGASSTASSWPLKIDDIPDSLAQRSTIKDLWTHF